MSGSWGDWSVCGNWTDSDDISDIMNYPWIRYWILSLPSPKYLTAVPSFFLRVFLLRCCTAEIKQTLFVVTTALKPFSGAHVPVAWINHITLNNNPLFGLRSLFGAMFCQCLVCIMYRFCKRKKNKPHFKTCFNSNLSKNMLWWFLIISGVVCTWIALFQALKDQFYKWYNEDSLVMGLILTPYTDALKLMNWL